MIFYNTIPTVFLKVLFGITAKNNQQYISFRVKLDDILNYAEFSIPSKYLQLRTKHFL